MCTIDWKYFDNYGKIYFVLDSTLNFRDYCFFFSIKGQFWSNYINLYQHAQPKSNPEQCRDLNTSVDIKKAILSRISSPHSEKCMYVKAKLE